VTSLAEEFGFIPTKYVECETLEQVQSFTQEIATSGSWEGDMIEGFVVRSTVKDKKGEELEGKPPYRPGSPFFFKVKFDEPYLLYRQWREVTRVMLPLLNPGLQPKDIADVWKKVRAKTTKRAEIALYADWVSATIKEDPSLFDDYDRGVVRVRDKFLAWTEQPEGKRPWKLAKDKKYKLKGGKVEPTVDRTILPVKHIIVPISIPGTGELCVLQLCDIRLMRSRENTNRPSLDKVVWICPYSKRRCYYKTICSWLFEEHHRTLIEERRRIRR
jgi:tRNA ligase